LVSFIIKKNFLSKGRDNGTNIAFPRMHGLTWMILKLITQVILKRRRGKPGSRNIIKHSVICRSCYMRRASRRFW